MGRWRRAWLSAGAVLVLAGAGCGGGPVGAPVRLDAGPAVAALIDPVQVSASGLPPAGLVTVQARAAGLGGSAQADALATEQFWTRMIPFLNHLAAHQPTPS